MKNFRRFLIMIGIGLLLTGACLAQDLPFRAGAVGIGYFAGNDPAFMGRGALFLPLGSTANAVSYTVSDVGVVKTGGQFQIANWNLTYKLQSGLGYRVFARNWFELWGLAAPGFVANGNNVIAAFQYGFCLGFKPKKGPEILIPLTADTSIATKFNPAIMIAFRF